MVAVGSRIWFPNLNWPLIDGFNPLVDGLGSCWCGGDKNLQDMFLILAGLDGRPFPSGIARIFCWPTIILYYLELASVTKGLFLWFLVPVLF